MTTQRIFDFLQEPDRLSSAPCPPVATDRESILRDLRSKAGCISTSPSDTQHTVTLSTGADAIDRLLPRGGLRIDAITEWIAQAEGCGAALLSLITAAIHLQSSHGRGPLVVVCGGGQFYPPAAISLGISASRIIWVRPTRHADTVWSIDQALRCKSVAAVWSTLGAHLDDRDARRFQLAAETGQTPGLLVRPVAVRGRPSFADVRFHVDHSRSSDQPEPDPSIQNRRMQITVDRCRGGTIGRSAWIQIDDRARLHSVPPQIKPRTADAKNETSVMHLASELAHPTAPDRKSPQRQNRRPA